MRLLPCKTPACRAKGAMRPPRLGWPQGAPALAAQFTARYKCSRCGTLQELTHSDYASLPSLDLDGFGILARQYAPSGAPHHPVLAAMPTADLIGTGFSRPQAEDLFRANIRTADHVHTLSREQWLSGPMDRDHQETLI